MMHTCAHIHTPSFNLHPDYTGTLTFFVEHIFATFPKTFFSFPLAQTHMHTHSQLFFCPPPPHPPSNLAGPWPPLFRSTVLCDRISIGGPQLGVKRGHTCLRMCVCDRERAGREGVVVRHAPRLLPQQQQDGSEGCHGA